MSYVIELGYVTESGAEVIVTRETYDGAPRLGARDTRQIANLDSEYAKVGIVALIERITIIEV